MSALRQAGPTVAAELAAVLARVDEDQFVAAADLIDEAKRVFVLGVGREGLAGRAFAMRLMHIGFEVHWGWDDTTPAVTPGDVLVLVNGSGRIGHLDYVFRLAMAAGAQSLVVTADPNAPTPRAANATLVVPATVYRGEGDLVPSIQPMGSLFEQATGVVFDLLVLELVERRGLAFTDLAARHRNFE